MSQVKAAYNVQRADLATLISQERERFRDRVVEIALQHAERSPDATALTDSLQFTATLPCGRVNHKDALKQIEILNDNRFQGHTDWRLPEVSELLSRVDYTRHDPATQDEGVESGAHWTNTPYAGDPAYAWFVYFLNGYSYYYHRGHLVAVVRAVRGPAARPGQ